MGSEANQINSSASDTLSYASSAAVAAFSCVDSKYGAAAKESIDAIVQSMASDIQATDVAQTDIIQSLTSKSVSLINSAAKKVVFEYANQAISNAFADANARAQGLEDTAKSSANVAISYFAGSAYGEASNYATPSEAVSGVNEFTAALNSAINNANFSSANVVLTSAADSLVTKTEILGTPSADAAHSAIASAVDQIINTIKTQAADIAGAESLAQSGVGDLESIASSAVISSANEAIEATYHRFKSDLVKVSDAVAQDALAAMEDVVAPTYDLVESNVAEPESVSSNVDEAIASMGSIFNSYGNDLVAAGTSEYASAAASAVAYLSGDDLSNANSMIASASAVVLASAKAINSNAADAVDRFYGLIPAASDAIKKIGESVNDRYVTRQLSAADASAAAVIDHLSADLKAAATNTINNYIAQVHQQVAGLLSQPDALQTTIRSAGHEIASMASSAVAGDPYAATLHSIASAVALANDQLSQMHGDAALNASSAVNVAAQQAYGDALAHRDAAIDLTQIGEKIDSTITQVIRSYATSAAFERLDAASNAAHSMIEQLSNVADQTAAASQVSQLHTDAKRAVTESQNVYLATNSGVDTINSVASALVDNDPTVSAYYAVQDVLSSTASKGVYLDSLSRDNADSEIAGVTSAASSAMNEDIGNANALGKDVERASLAADEIVNRYNVNSAQSEMGSLASSANHYMEHIGDAEIAVQASSAVTSIQDSLTATLNRAADRLSTISLAMSSAYSSIDSITARYVGADIVAAAYSNVNALASSAAQATAQFDDYNHANADSEVDKQISRALSNLASTHDHNEVASQASQTVNSILNRYTLSYTNVALSSAADSASRYLDSFGLLGTEASMHINHYVDIAHSNVNKDAKYSEMVLLDLRNGFATIDSFVDATVTGDLQASAIRKVQSNASAVLSARSAADFDFANFSSAVAKAADTNCETISQIKDGTTVNQLISVAHDENERNFKHNVIGSATNELKLVADDVRKRLVAANLTAGATVDQIVARYTQLIEKDALTPQFAELDSQNGIKALKEFFFDTLSDQPKVAQNYAIDSQVASASSMAGQYLADSVALDRDLYRAASSATSRVNSADNEFEVSNAAADLSATVDSIANSHIASSALETVQSATSSANARVSNIKDTGKLLDAKNEIHSMAQDGVALIKADSYLPRVVNTDVRNTLSKLDSMTSAAVSDDLAADTVAKINSLTASASAGGRFENSSAALNFDSQVAKLVSATHSAVADADNEVVVEPRLASLATNLDQLADQFKLSSVHAQVSAAAVDAKHQLAHLRGQDQSALAGQVDSIADQINAHLKADLNHSQALNTDINNVLLALDNLVTSQVAANSYAVADQALRSVVTQANSTAATISGSIAANLSSEIASADSQYAHQLAEVADDAVSSVADQAVAAIQTTTNNYVTAYAADMIANTREQLLAAARAYSGVPIDNLEGQFNAIIENGLENVQNDSHDIDLALLDANNIIAALNQKFNQIVNASGEAKYQHTLDHLKQSAFDYAGSMDSFAIANMHSALNSAASAASGQSAVASEAMAGIVNSYHASNAKAEVSVAASTAHKAVLQLSNVTKISTSAAINKAVDSANTEIMADVVDARYTSLDAKDGIAAINSLLDSAIANDSVAATRSLAASATSVAFERMGSMTTHDSLVAANEIQQIVDRFVGNHRAKERMFEEIGTVTNHYLERSASQRINAKADAVRTQLQDSSNLAAGKAAIKETIVDAMGKIESDITNPAYLALDIDNAMIALDRILDKYQDNQIAIINANINSAAQQLTGIAHGDGIEQSNVSSAAASVARIAIQNIATVSADSNAVSAFTASANAQFTELRKSYFANSANSVIQSAISSAQVNTEAIADSSNAARINDQFSGVAESFKQVVANDAINASLAALDADNAVLEIEQINAQAILNNPLASANYVINSAVSDAFSNAYLMTQSQSDNYESAMAKVVEPLSKLRDPDSQDLTLTVSSIQNNIASVANSYYGAWATSAVSKAAFDLFSAANQYNGAVANSAVTLTSSYQAQFTSQVAKDGSAADLIVLDAQNAVSAINSTASEAAANDSIAFANSAISEQISSANSVLTELTGHTDSTADMQMDSVANQANEKLGSVYSNLNAVMMVISSASGAMREIANLVVASSAHTAVASAADSLMVKAGQLAEGNTQSDLISMVKQSVEHLDNNIDANTNYPVSVSMAAVNGIQSMVAGLVESFKENRAASAEIALQSLASSAAQQVGDLDSFASANFSSAVGSINSRTNAYLADQLNSPKRIDSEIKYAGETIQSLISEAIAKSANGYVHSQAKNVTDQLATIADADLRSQVDSQIAYQLKKADLMIKSDAFDYQLARLDAYNNVKSVSAIAASAFATDSGAMQSIANSEALSSAHVKVGSLNATQVVTFDSQIAALSPNDIAEYRLGLDSIANRFIENSANAVLDRTLASANHSANVISDTNNQNSLLHAINQHRQQASLAVSIDAHNAKFASLDANNAASAIASMVNDAIEKDPVASASVMIQKAVSSVTDGMSSLAADQQIRFNKQVASLTSNANMSLIGPFADKNNVISQASSQIASLANAYMISSAYSAVGELASSASAQTADLAANDSLSVKTYIDSALSSADSQISLHSDFASLVADAVYDAANTVEHLASDAVNNSPMAAAKHSLASVRSSATVIASSLSGRNAANFSSAIASVAQQAVDSFTPDDATTNQQALQNAAQLMRNISNFHAAQGAINQVIDAANEAEKQIDRLADNYKRSKAFTEVANTIDEYRLRIQNDTDNLALINLDVINGQNEMARLASAAIQDDDVASAVAVLDSYASSVTDQAQNLNSLASANLSSAVSDITSKAVNNMQTVWNQPETLKTVRQAAAVQMDSLLDSYVTNSAMDHLASIRSAIDERIASVQTTSVAAPIKNALDGIQGSIANLVTQDAHSQPFVQLDLNNARQLMNSAANSAVTANVSASAAYQINDFVTVANSRAQHLVGSAADNFSSAIKSVARQASQAAHGVTDYRTLDTIITATDKEVNSTVSNYLVTSAHSALANATSSANAALREIKGQVRADANKLLNSGANSAAQLISNDAFDDQLISLDVKEGTSAIASVTSSVVASQPFASAYSVIASTAEAAMQRVGSLDSFAFANLSSAMNRFNNEARASLAALGADDQSIKTIESNTVTSINDVANSYVASSASELVTAATNSAYSVINQFNNEEASATANETINDTLTNVANEFAKDRNNASLMALDAANAIDSIHSAAQFITTTDEVASGNIYLSNTADSAYSATAGLGKTTQLDKQIKDIIADTNSRFANDEDVDNVLNDATDKIEKVVNNFVTIVAEAKLASFLSTTDARLKRFLNSDGYLNAQTELANYEESAKNVLHKDAHSGELIQLDLLNIENHLTSLADSLVADQSDAVALSAVADKASAAVQNGYQQVADDYYLNFSSAVNAVVRSFDANNVLANSEQAFSQIDSLAQSYVASQAISSVEKATVKLDAQVKELSNFVTQSSAYSAVHAIASQAVINIQSDNADFGAVSLDTDNAISSANAILDNAITNDSVAAGKRSVESIYSSAASFATGLNWSDSVEFSMTLAAQSAQASFGADANNASIAASTASFINAAANRYVASYANSAIESTASVAIINLSKIGDAKLRSNFTGVIDNVVSDIKQNVASDNADQSLVDIDVQNGINTINSIADSMVREGPAAAGQYLIASAASSAMNSMAAGSPIDEANFTSAIDSVANQASLSVSLVSKNLVLVNKAAHSSSNKMNKLATNYRNSLAQSKLSSKFDSANATVSYFSDAQLQSSIASGMDSVREHFSSLISADASSADYVDLDLENGISELNRMLTSAAAKDPAVKTRFLLDSVASAAANRLATLSDSVQANFSSAAAKINSQTNGMVSYAASDTNLVSAATSSTVATFESIADSYMATSAESAVSQIVADAEKTLQLFANVDVRQQVRTQIEQFRIAANQTIREDAFNDDLLALDVRNMQRSVSNALNKTIASDIYASANHHVQSVAASLTATNGLQNAVESTRMQLQMSSAASRASADITGAGMNNDLINVTVDSTASLMNSIAQQFTVHDAQSQVASFANSAKAALSWFATHNDASFASGVSKLTSLMNNQIDYYAADHNARQLMLQRGKKQLTTYVASLVAADPQAATSAAVASFATSATSAVASISGSVRANFDSEVATMTNNANAMNQKIVLDNATADQLTDSVADAFTQVTRKYIANDGYDSLDTLANSATERFQQYGVGAEQVAEPLQEFIREYNSMVDSDAGVQPTVSLDCRNAKDEMNDFIADVVSDDLVSYAKWAVQQTVDSVTDSIGAIQNASAAANFSSAVASAVDVANDEIDRTPYDENLVNQKIAAASDQLGSLAHRYVVDSANAELQSAHSSASQLISQFSLADSLATIASSYSEMVKRDGDNSAFASLDADNGSIAMDQFAKSAVNAAPQAALSYQVHSVAAKINQAATSFASADQIWFSSAVASVVSAATGISVVDDRHQKQIVASADQQMHSVANRFIAKTALADLDVAVSSAAHRVAILHNDAAEAVISNAAVSASSAVIANSANPLATSLYAHDGKVAAHSLANSLIADQPLATEIDRVNQLVDSATHGVLMSDSLADMNFLSAVAKQSKQATDAFRKAASNPQSLSELASQAQSAIASVADRYVAESAQVVLDSATSSAMTLVNAVANNVERSQATNWINNQVSDANAVIAKDAGNDSLVALDIDNAILAINSVTNNAAESDANLTFDQFIGEAFSSATDQATMLSGSLAANFSSAINSANTSIRATNQSLSSVNDGVLDSASEIFANIASTYVAQSAIGMVAAKVADVKQQFNFDEGFVQQLDYLQMIAKQTIQSDAYDFQLATLDAVNAINSLDGQFSAAVATNQRLAFDQKLASQASSASAKVGVMDSHSTANFSSAVSRIANNAKNQANTFGNSAAAIDIAASAMNSLVNGYVLASARSSMNSIVDSANFKIATVDNYTLVENAINSVAANTSAALVADNNDSAVVSLRVTDLQSQADSLVDAAIAADHNASAMNTIYKLADSLMSDAEFSGHAKASFASITASTASSASYNLVGQSDPRATINEAKKLLKAAAKHFIIETATEIVNKALDVANNRAVEIDDIHKRNQTISAIGTQVSDARKLIQQNANNPFFAYLDAQNAAVRIAEITKQAVESDPVANAILEIARAADQVVNKLRPLIDSNEEFRLNNRLLNIVDTTNRAINSAAGNWSNVRSQASTAEHAFNSIASSYVAESANAIVVSAGDSAAIQIEGLDNTATRNEVSQLINMLVDSASSAIASDANEIAYASLDADNAASTINSVTASAIAADPSTSANATISDQIASTADTLAGMDREDQAAFSSAVLSVVADANVQFASAAEDANVIASITDQTMTQLGSVAREFVVTSAKAVVNGAASAATHLLDSMFDDSSATIYSSVASVVNEAITAVNSDSSNFATVSLDAYNASSAIDQLVKNNENSYAHSSIDSQASFATSLANVLNDTLRPVAVNGISLHASAAHSAVNLHFGQAEATLSDVNSAASAMDSLINEYVVKDPVASAHSVVASAASSANNKAANLNSSYIAELGTSISSAATQANTLIAMNPANSLLDSQLASDAASSMNSFVNMFEAAAANEATTSYAASAYAQIDVMDDEFKQLANKAVAFEVDNAKKAFAVNEDNPRAIFDNVHSAADNMKFLVANYTAKNSSAVVDAKQSFAADMESLTGDVYSQARVLSINNRGQINSLTGSVANSASANVSDAITISNVASTFHSANALIGSVATVAIDFARETARAELANAANNADQALNSMEPNAKQAVIASIDTLMSGIRGRITIATNTVDIINDTKHSIERIQKMVTSALSANLLNIKDSYKTQIMNAATAAYQDVNGLSSNAQSLTNAAISMAASDANANIDQTNQLAEIQMLTSAGIASINEASSVAVSNVKASGNSLIVSAANSATGRTATLAPGDKSAANSVINSLANSANTELNIAGNVEEASAAITTGTSAISSAIDSTITSVISSAMAMANNLAAQNERDSFKLQIKSAADAAYASTASLDSSAASAVNEYVSRTASIADRQIAAAEDEDEVNEIARSGVAALQSATNSAAGIYVSSLRSSAESMVDSAANSAFMLTDAFNEATRYSMNKSIAQIADGTKFELKGTNDEHRANELIDLTISNLNRLISENNYSQLDTNRADAKSQISANAEAVINTLGSVSAISRQTITKAIQNEVDLLNNKVNKAYSAVEIQRVVDSSRAKFESQIKTVSSRELQLSQSASKQVLSGNSQNALAKLTGINDVIIDTAKETIDELLAKAYKNIDDARTVERITDITNETSADINRIVKESILMNDRMS